MARYQEFNTPQSRKLSFQDSFPKRGITADEFADSGFFYFGLEDKTCCFYCGVGLHGWENTDDPWKQHAKFSPHCIYLLSKKGNEFVENISRIKFPIQVQSDMEIISSSEDLHQSSMWKITRKHKLSKFLEQQKDLLL